MDRLGDYRRHRRSALRAAGRHHQSFGIRAGKFNRSSDLGRGRRTRHALRRHPWRNARQSRQDMAHQRAAGYLALRDRRVVHRCHIVSAARYHRPIHHASATERQQTSFGGDRGVDARSRAMSEDTLLYLDGVTVSFDGFKALNELSLMLEPGEMRAVIGPNGAGKTTMMDVITGKTRPDAGRVVFGADIDLTRLDEPDIAALGIGRKFQKPTVFEPLSVWDNLLLALAGDRSPRFSLWARETAEERERIEAILATTQLTEHRARRAADLSHGQK